MKVISLGWGVQSWTLAAMAALGEIEADVAIHADTFWEKQATYGFIQQWQPWLEAKGLRVVTVGEPAQAVDKVRTENTDIPAYTVNQAVVKTKTYIDEDIDELYEDETDEAITIEVTQTGMLRRQCTSRWKIQPIRKWIAAELESQGLRKTAGIIESLQGISLDEWQRMKDSDVRWIVNRYPLVEKRMTRGDCMTWLAAHGLAVPPKSACVFCPFQSINTWRELKRNGGQDWATAMEIDLAIRDVRPPYDLFVHPARVPLTEAVSIPEDSGFSQTSMFDGDGCESGYCFV